MPFGRDLVDEIRAVLPDVDALSGEQAIHALRRRREFGLAMALERRLYPAPRTDARDFRVAATLIALVGILAAAAVYWTALV